MVRRTMLPAGATAVLSCLPIPKRPALTESRSRLAFASADFCTSPNDNSSPTARRDSFADNRRGGREGEDHTIMLKPIA